MLHGPRTELACSYSVMSDPLAIGGYAAWELHSTQRQVSYVMVTYGGTTPARPRNSPSASAMFEPS